MSTILESLKSYFAENSLEKIKSDWAEFEKYDNVGPKIDEFLHQSKIFHEIEGTSSFWRFSSINQITENPKFASDFFLHLSIQ